ncbi:MAG: type II toxin-antitoxin system prevent-host-death family antitoxin [Corynebacterium sp.]|uniref:type II toxin-antitoxin system prevent-host-death family antitoxin n=1 Tax=Corynebacterium sp. TaxID=1720 RepID=UPI0026E05616|nr:type II toxin-antitoxin system prevent-host-death family antitoxin [Corynebacterium sp.]MDO5670686.1 type II toxin-antitoxin system prevent-host-death family antitoxin [Corynebacterium sp.]
MSVPVDKVSLRELNQRSGRIIDVVRRGRSVVVTDRGKPVAKIVPYEAESVVEKLLAEGLARPAAWRSTAEGPKEGWPLLQLPEGIASADLLAEDRHE